MASTGQARFRSLGWRPLVVFIGFAAIGALLLSTEHRAHALGALPLLLIFLLCPLMHFFMHGRHGRHGSSGAAGDDTDSSLRHGDRIEQHRH